MKQNRFLVFGLALLLMLFILHCRSKEHLLIMTVTGPINGPQMGKTLEHEHILVDFIGADSTGYHRWDREEVIPKVLPYLLEIKQLGYKTLVECTPAYLGRDPRLLHELSQQSGIQLLTNTGYYGARSNQFIPQHAFDESANELAARWITEWEDGIEDTGIRPGFIKIAVDRDDTLSTMHEKLIRAAARTHLKTGLSIKSHTGPEQPALAQIDILKKEAVAPDAFIWVHAQRGTRESHIRVAKMGAWISRDNMKDDPERIAEFVDFLQYMKSEGLLHRVLISHDAGWYRVGEPNGGSFRPYTAIHHKLIPALQENGFSQSDIDQLLVINPQHAFGIRIRAL